MVAPGWVIITQPPLKYTIRSDIVGIPSKLMVRARYQMICASHDAGMLTCRQWESNPHCPGSEPGASYLLGYNGVGCCLTRPWIGM